MKISSKKITVVFTGLTGEEYHPDSGGIELAEYSFCEKASKMGFDISAIVGSSGKKELTITNPHAQVIRIPTSPFIKGGLVDFWPFALRSASEVAIKALHDEDIVHFTSLIPTIAFINNPAFYYLIKNCRYKTKFIYTLHNYHYSIADYPEDIFAKYPAEWQFLHNSEMEIINKANAVSVASDNYAPILSKKFSKKIVYIPNTIGKRADYKVIESSHDKLIVLLTMSRLSGEKNIANALRAFARIKTVFANAKYIIAGDGELKGDLIDEGKKNGLRLDIREDGVSLDSMIEDMGKIDVMFAGQVSKVDKQELYNLADVFLLPSLREVCPLVGLECLVYGKRVVASDIYGWRDYHDRGAEILLSDPNNVEDIEENILRSLDGIKKNRRAIKEKNWSVDERYYSPDVVIPKRIQFYNSIQENSKLCLEMN